MKQTTQTLAAAIRERLRQMQAFASGHVPCQEARISPGCYWLRKSGDAE